MSQELLDEVLLAFSCPPDPRMPGTTLEEALALVPRVAPRDFEAAVSVLHRDGLLERVGTRRYEITIAGEGRLTELG